MTVESFEGLEKDTKKIPRYLLKGKKRTGGRNSAGRITSYHRGGGTKKKYRIIEFKRIHIGVDARVDSFHYDPNRNARLALLFYKNGAKSFILAPEKLKVGDKVECGPDADIKPGNALPLTRIPVGTQIHCIELKPGSGAQLVRAAGLSAMLAGKDGKNAQVKLPSGELRLIPLESYACIGQVGNMSFETRVLGKAGRSRWLGRRPHVRGAAMNPVDHPHGGGEGRSKGGRHPVSPWGQPTKGFKTRKNKRTDSRIIRGRTRGKMTGGKGRR